MKAEVICKTVCNSVPDDNVYNLILNKYFDIFCSKFIQSGSRIKIN